MEIIKDDLCRPEIEMLLQQHLDHMYEISPPESVHALDLQALRRSNVTFWCAWDEGDLLGCGALQELSPKTGEIKSMRTAEAHRRKGVAEKLLMHIIEVSKQRGYVELSLETGTTTHFSAAQKLYQKYGFTPCGPFANYKLDPHSLFMNLKL